MPQHRNVVPYKNGEGHIGTDDKRWSTTYVGIIDGLHTINLVNTSILKISNLGWIGGWTDDKQIDFTAGLNEDGYGMKWDENANKYRAQPISAGNVLSSLSDTDMNAFGGLEAGESLRYSTSGSPDTGWYPYPLHYGHMSQNRVNQQINPIPLGTTWIVNTSPVTNVQYVTINLIESGDDTAFPSWYSAPGHWIHAENSGLVGMTVYQRGSQVRISFASQLTYLGTPMTASEWTVRIDIHGD